ncbi:hypothetical protein [Bradyrhizobium sp. HKCCYLRH1062]|uniref:hypothetical protein n=1 Tax=unclassified Bradyrhizobium TaxID=2631580 RepID=UPI003EBC6884
MSAAIAAQLPCPLRLAHPLLAARQGFMAAFRRAKPQTKEKIMSSSQPAFIGYSVNKREGKPAIWAKIGAAFPHKGTGFTIQLDALPLGDRIVLREPKDDKTVSPDASKGGAQ